MILIITIAEYSGVGTAEGRSGAVAVVGGGGGRRRRGGGWGLGKEGVVVALVDGVVELQRR